VGRILVTGGLGTVGSGIVRELRNRNFDVLSLDLYHQPDQHTFSLHPDEITPAYVRCDIGMYRQLERVFIDLGPFDMVYNCAAEFGRWNGEDYYEQLWQTNVIGTKNMIRLQEKYRFKLVHFSSSEVYGDWPNLMTETVMDEYAIKQMNDYAMTKWTNEMQIRNSIQLNGTETVTIRLFNTYGPGEFYSPYRSVNCRFLYCALKGIPWVVFRGHKRTSTFLPDTVNTLCNITNNFLPGEVYNIGGDTLHTIEELSDAIIKVTGANKSLVQYKESEHLTTKEKHVDAHKSTRDLGHKNTISLLDGLAVTSEWMKKTHAL
jgi:dTDP-glucose 4,6-dehydratase